MRTLIGLLVCVCFASVSGADMIGEYLIASDGAEGDYFGVSVAISGDYVLVGASGDDDNGSNSGSAYIFHREGGVWTQQAKLTADDGASNDYFGFSVALSGEYALVGANSDGGNRGSAYIFHREGGVWTQQAKLTAEDGASGDYFGCSVSLSGDYALVGAQYNDDNASNSGSAYIFHREGGVWTQQAKLTARDRASNDYFGRSVSLSGDYALVGARMDDDKGSSSGSTYLFHREVDSWTQQEKIVANDESSGDLFGYSVSLSGEYALVGALGDDDNGSDSGSAYIFHREGDSWIQSEKIVATYGNINYFFGTSVALSGSYLSVGSTGDSYNGTNAGSVYIFGFSGTGVPVVTNVTIEPNPVEKGQPITIRANAAVR